jgi:hypothetical protein
LPTRDYAADRPDFTGENRHKISFIERETEYEVVGGFTIGLSVFPADRLSPLRSGAPNFATGAQKERLARTGRVRAGRPGNFCRLSTGE